MLQQTIKMQGFSQAIITGDPDTLPQSLKLGPNELLILAQTVLPNGNVVQPTFEYASPNPDIQGTLDSIRALIAMFLSSKNIDPNTIAGNADGGQTYGSGIERLLANLEKFEASKDDYDLFERVEDQVWNILKAWHNVSIGTDLLDKKYLSTMISPDSEISVEFAKPELHQTEREKSELNALKEQNKQQSRVDSIMDMYNIDDRDQAKELISRIDLEQSEYGSPAGRFLNVRPIQGQRNEDSRE
jgi:hypothetical protein